MRPRNFLKMALLGACTLGFATSALAQAADDDVSSDIGTLTKDKIEKIFPLKRPYSPYADRSFPSRFFFGDTHLHTAISFDAGAFGARLGPRDAYRFAKGQQVTSSTGQPA